MFLKERTSGDLVEIAELPDLFNMYSDDIVGRFQCGEEAQEPERFSKSALVFPSGEELPQCWIDPHYRDHKLRRR